MQEESLPAQSLRVMRSIKLPSTTLGKIGTGIGRVGTSLQAIASIATGLTNLFSALGSLEEAMKEKCTKMVDMVPRKVLGVSCGRKCPEGTDKVDSQDPYRSGTH